MKRKHINYAAILIAFILAWSLFTFSDYCEENLLLYYDALMGISLCVIPVIIGMLYLIFEKRINSAKISKAMNTWAIIGVWIGINTITGFIVCYMVSYNKWIVKQATGGWENFLNGIEYFIFPFFLGIIPIIIVAIWRLISFIYNNAKKSKITTETDIVT